MKNFAGRLYNKDESDILGIVEAENKKHARKLLREQYGKEYKIGQIFEIDRVVGKQYLSRNEPSVLRCYTREEKIDLLEEQLEFWSAISMREEIKYDQLKEADENYHPDAYRRSGLPKKLGLKPIQPGSKYDREHFDERGRRITRKEWKRRRKAAVAS